MNTKNKLTSIFGIVAALPQFLATTGLTLPGKWGGILSTVGMLGLGLVAKDFNQSHTMDKK